MGAPFGHQEGEDHIGHEGRQGDPGKDGWVLPGQIGCHQQHLQRRGHDAVEGEIDQGADPPGATLDVAGEATGLSVQVKSQRQLVQMPKDTQRDVAHGALGDPRENEFAHLGEPRRSKPHEAIADHQRQGYGDGCGG